MRHVPIQNLLEKIFANSEGKTDKRRLERAHVTVAQRPADDRKTYIDNNGPAKWSPLKNRFTAELGNKCWYTEAELVGASLAIDHYRPKCDYWFLAFNPYNYRVACPYANSPKYNEEHGCAGGKGDNFPLLDETKKARRPRTAKYEKPIILDPCNEDDCKLIAFQSDGRPVLNPAYVDDPVAKKRVEKSKLLLNLDHPHFNTKREQLYNEIKLDINTYENLPEGSDLRGPIRDRILSRISKTAPFSTAARHYVSTHRELDWVESILT